MADVLQPQPPHHIPTMKYGTCHSFKSTQNSPPPTPAPPASPEKSRHSVPGMTSTPGESTRAVSVGEQQECSTDSVEKIESLIQHTLSGQLHQKHLRLESRLTKQEAVLTCVKQKLKSHLQLQDNTVYKILTTILYKQEAKHEAQKRLLQQLQGQFRRRQKQITQQQNGAKCVGDEGGQLVNTKLTSKASLYTNKERMDKAVSSPSANLPRQARHNGRHRPNFSSSFDLNNPLSSPHSFHFPSRSPSAASCGSTSSGYASPMGSGSPFRPNSGHHNCYNQNQPGTRSAGWTSVTNPQVGESKSSSANSVIKLEGDGREQANSHGWFIKNGQRMVHNNPRDHPMEGHMVHSGPLDLRSGADKPTRRGENPVMTRGDRVVRSGQMYGNAKMCDNDRGGDGQNIDKETQKDCQNVANSGLAQNVSTRCSDTYQVSSDSMKGFHTKDFQTVKRARADKVYDQSMAMGSIPADISTMYCFDNITSPVLTMDFSENSEVDLAEMLTGIDREEMGQYMGPSVTPMTQHNIPPSPLTVNSFRATLTAQPAAIHLPSPAYFLHNGHVNRHPSGGINSLPAPGALCGNQSVHNDFGHQASWI